MTSCVHGLSRTLESNGIAITFVGEPAQDAGGPTRELFRLLWKDLNSNASIFCGREDNRIPAHNVLALRQEEFVMVGRCISLALMYGGTGPHFFQR